MGLLRMEALACHIGRGNGTVVAQDHERKKNILKRL
jgi:hypothetical protein